MAAADYDDAENPMGGERVPPRERPQPRGRGGNPLARAWGWFAVQPAQTKVIILGVIVVLGVVIYMTIKNRNSKQVDTTGQETTGKFYPLGAHRWRGTAAGATPMPGPTDGSVNPPGSPPGNTVGNPGLNTNPITNGSGTFKAGGGSGLPIIAKTPPQTYTPTPTPPAIQPVASAPVPAPTVTPGAMNLKGTNYEIDKVYQPTPIPAPVFVPSAPNKSETTTATLIYRARAPKPAPTYTGAAPGKTAGATLQRGTNFLI